MQDSPDVDVRLSLDVEDQIGKAPYDPGAEAGESQVVRVAGRIAGGVRCHSAGGFFQRVDKGERNSR